MEAIGCTIDEAIADACARDYAEADPSADLDGVDAAAKLAILCALGFRLRLTPTQIDTRTTARRSSVVMSLRNACRARSPRRS
jgi:homoserine dehydrogenase